MAMLENLIRQNSQLNNVWQMAQQLSQNNNKQEVIKQIAQQKGMKVEEVVEMAKSYGINI
nr:hypothetical protein [Clostridia bacterium]